MERAVVSETGVSTEVDSVAIALTLDPGRACFALWYVAVVVGLVSFASGLVSNVIQPTTRDQGQVEREACGTCINVDTRPESMSVAVATAKTNAANGNENLGPIRDIFGGLLRVPHTFAYVLLTESIKRGATGHTWSALARVGSVECNTTPPLDGFCGTRVTDHSNSVGVTLQGALAEGPAARVPYVKFYGKRYDIRSRSDIGLGSDPRLYQSIRAASSSEVEREGAEGSVLEVVGAIPIMRPYPSGESSE